jgi:hypothetical protein
MNTICKSCGAPVRWATLPSGRAAPLDAEPSEDGTIALADDPRFGSVLRKEQRAKLPAGTLLYRSHFGTCPAANELRRAR